MVLGATDGIMLSAAVRLFGRPIIVLTPDGHEQIVDTDDTDKSCTEHIRLGFINNSHYVSINHLRPAEEVEEGDGDAIKPDEHVQETQNTLEAEEPIDNMEKPERESKEPL